MKKKELTLLEQAQKFNNSSFDPNSTNFKAFKMGATNAEDIARLFFRRDFNTIPFDLLNQEDFYNEVTIVYPSDDYFRSQIDNIEELSEEEIVAEIETKIDEWYESSLEIYSNLYLMIGWGTEDYYTDGDCCNADVLAEFGFRVLKYKDYTFLNVPGYGYSIMMEHFVRLFTFLGWMKVEE